jgi:hypothetical protein
MAVNVVTPGNLGLSIKPAAVTAGKYDVNVDNTTITISALGVVKANLTNAQYDAMVKSFETKTTLVNTAAGVYTYTNEAGVVTTINIPADKFLANSTYSSATKTLTLTLSDSSVINVPLNDLVPVTVASSSSIAVTGDGTSATPLTAATKISATAGNQLVVNGTGLYVPAAATAAQTPLTAIDSDSIDFGTSGTDNHTVTGVVKLNTTVGNLLTSTVTGLQVTPTAVTALATIDVQDAFGVHQFFAFP